MQWSYVCTCEVHSEVTEDGNPKSQLLFFENLHPDGNLGAFFIPINNSMPFFVSCPHIFIILSGVVSQIIFLTLCRSVILHIHQSPIVHSNWSEAMCSYNGLCSIKQFVLDKSFCNPLPVRSGKKSLSSVAGSHAALSGD